MGSFAAGLLLMLFACGMALYLFIHHQIREWPWK